MNGVRMRPAHGSAGFSTVAGVLSIAAGLVIVLMLALLSAGTFSGSSKNSPGTGILSTSSQEKQLQLCVEGRPSTLTGGVPPSPHQEQVCTSDLAAQAGGGGGPLPSSIPAQTTTSLGQFGP